MSKRGRPTQLNKEKTAEICQLLRMGNYIETAAAYAGISKTTLYNWLKRGRREMDRVNQDNRRKIRKAEQIYVDFVNSVEKAMAEAEIRDVQIIYNAGKDDWKASAWRLERKFPDRWGRKDSHEISGKDGGPIEIKGAKEKLLRKIKSLQQNEEGSEE